MNFPPVFDGHNDTLLNLAQLERGNGRSFFERSDIGHIDLPRAKEGGLGGGFFAMFTPNPPGERPYADPTKELASTSPDHIQLPPELDHHYALKFCNALIVRLLKIVEKSKGAVKIVYNINDLETYLKNGTLAVIMHIEGAESIDGDFNSLHVLHAAGLRSRSTGKNCL